jgi:DNA helicase-2/ATP-dependent DNA helicase PcrA
VFGEYQPTEPSRFLKEIPSELVDQVVPTYSSQHSSPFIHSHYEFRTNPYGRRGRGRVREAEAAYAYEDEDQSISEFRSGMRVRHEKFGVGTVTSVEPQHDDLKVTVRFNSVGVKRLMAKYARLQPA